MQAAVQTIDPRRAQSRPAVGEPAVAPARRVLVIDSDERTRRVDAAVLASAGFAVAEADDGEAGWDLLLSSPCDLVVTTYLMPKVSGPALVRRMRVAGMWQPVILTAWSPQDVLASHDPWQRIDAFVAKPYSSTDLLREVEHLLDAAAHAAQG